MILGGLQACSFSDYPGRTAAVIFTQGCNFRCPFCHNVSLLARRKPADISEEDCFEFLGGRRGYLDGVVVSGGEPTIHADLPGFIRKLRSFGYPVKLDTNGSNPEVVGHLIAENLVDYIAMDIKAPLEMYEKLSGVFVDTEKICTSISCIAKSGIPHHFRTTEVHPLLAQEDLHAITSLVPAGSRYVLQPFVADNASLMESTVCPV